AVAQITAALEQARGKRPTLVSVCGAPGVGKSTLIAAASELAWGHGGAVLYGKFEPSSVPYSGVTQGVATLVTACASGRNARDWADILGRIGKFSAQVLVDFCADLVPFL